MAGKKKRKREVRPTIHPNNKYSDNPPDFSLLASLYPSFEPFVFHSKEGRPRIDWTDFNATRELTRVLLLHDHGLQWWIPDGQLCPTVPNRSNYIHWIGDLLSSGIIPKTDRGGGDNVRGFDIGTGANCIYPLLGASILGWSFVGSDVTDVALEWAGRNVKDNPHISELIEVRRVETVDLQSARPESVAEVEQHASDKTSLDEQLQFETNQEYHGPPVLLGVVRDTEKFDFCMCNPPFFETMEEAGLNPKTSCGGTPREMVCPGGERAFITRIIEDSTTLKQTFRWYTSMVGRKVNLKFLISKLWEVGVSTVKTTEFVQGQTSRWGLAWSFLPPVRKTYSPRVSEKTSVSFMLEGIQRQYGAINVMQTIESFFCPSGASCNLNANTFVVDVTASHDQCYIILKNDEQHSNRTTNFEDPQEKVITSSCLGTPTNELCFRILVFQQTPGTLLVKSSLKQGYSLVSGFILVFCNVCLSTLVYFINDKRNFYIDNETVGRSFERKILPGKIKNVSLKTTVSGQLLEEPWTLNSLWGFGL